MLLIKLWQLVDGSACRCSRQHGEPLVEISGMTAENGHV